MNSDGCKKTVICFTALVETSPQALPLGAACIASSLKQSSYIKNNAQVFLEDVSMESYSGKSTEETACAIFKILSEKFKHIDVLLFSVYVWNRKVLEECALLFKQKNPSVKIIAGGCEVTANPFNFKGFDFTVSGEGENSTTVLVEEILKNPDLSRLDVTGIYSLKDFSSGQCCKSLRSAVPELEKLSSPYLDGTLDPLKYGGALWELARGCPFKCSYCYESKGEKKIQHFPKERLLEELKLFAKLKLPQVFVLDPTYNANKNKALEMLKEIQKIAPETFFYFEARAEFIDRELSRAFSKVNCALQFGLQSADPEVLKKVNRTLDKEKFKRNISYLNNDGVIFGFDLIYGLPGDTLTGFKNSVDFALSLYPNNLELFCLSVLPGTDLADSAESLGLKWMESAPYNVTETSHFSKDDVEKARTFSLATDIFYNQGRAVPYFNSMTHYLRMKPSVFFSEFESYLKLNYGNLLEKNQNVNLSFEQVKEIQKKFICTLLKKKNLVKAQNLAFDLIELNGAFSLLTAEGKESSVKLTYHSDDLMSEASLDWNFFIKNARPFRNTTKVFKTKNGSDWKIL